MHLKKIILENFRQFYGKQEIDLDVTQGENIIVIHGENGSGKTTLLEAFSWCLYGEINLSNKNSLLNEKVFFGSKSEKGSEVRVTILFDDRHKSYLVTRSVKVKNISGKQYYTKDDIDFAVMVDGKLVDNKNSVIDKILSKDLKGYFFFDGERIDNLSKPENASEIEDGIKNIMGIAVYEKAIYHLGLVKKELTEDLKNVSVDSDTTPYEIRETLEDELNELKTKLKNITLYKDSKQNELNLINEELSRVQELESYERERDELLQERSGLESRLEKLIVSEKNYISKKGYLGISTETISRVHNFLEDKREKGELPSGIREQFIQDLIERGECICGTPIRDGDEHYRHLNDLLNKTVKKGVEDGFLQLSSFTGKYLDFREQFKEKIKDFSEKKIEIGDRLNSIAGQLEDLNKVIKESAHGSSAELIAKREEVERIINESIEKIGEYKSKIKDYESKIDAINREIEAYVAKSSQEEIAEARIELCERSLKMLEREYETLKDRVREKLSEKVGSVFGSIIPAYKARINNKFELEITKRINDMDIRVSTSTGENQIASLSFIGSLVHLAKEWDEQGKSGLLTGAGVYPIVMDSPFGSLDNEYRDLISAHLQKLSPQIIVLASSSQWSKEVEKNLKPYIHHEYILQYHAPESSGYSSEYKSIEIDGTVYDLAVTDDFEYTKVIKVK